MLSRLSTTLSGIILVTITGCTSLALKTTSTLEEGNNFASPPALVKTVVVPVERV